MNLNIARKMDEKRAFVREIEELLKKDQRNNRVDSLQYRVAFYSENHYDEYVDIVYTDGSVRKQLVSGLSKGKTLNEIVKAVYG